MLQQLNKKTLTRFQVSWWWLFSKIAILFPLSHSFLPHPLTQSAIPMRRPYSWGMGFMWSQRGWGVLSFPWILGPNGHSALALMLAKAQAGSYWRSRALLAQAVSSNCVLGSWYFWGGILETAAAGGCLSSNPAAGFRRSEMQHLCFSSKTAGLLK